MESWNCLSWKGPLKAVWSNSPATEQGHLELDQVALFDQFNLSTFTRRHKRRVVFGVLPPLGSASWKVTACVGNGVLPAGARAGSWDFWVLCSFKHRSFKGHGPAGSRLLLKAAQCVRNLQAEEDRADQLSLLTCQTNGNIHHRTLSVPY